MIKRSNTPNKKQSDNILAKESNLRMESLKEKDLKEIAGGRKHDIPSLISTAFKILKK